MSVSRGISRGKFSPGEVNKEQANMDGKVNRMDICAPFAGVVHYHVTPGQRVEPGETLAVVEAVKLEAPVVSPVAGTVGSLDRDDFSNVDGGDRIVAITD
ncbi:Biotin-requiring enzyme [Corynebacterium kroppenstedtii]|nr:Biotin-requiring enzyme [Corynebacterium kroppenstedtii]